MKAKLQNLKAIAQRAALGAGALVAAGVAHAQTAPTTPSMTELTSQVSFADVMVGIFAIGGLLAALYASMKGVRIILGMIRGR
ncbi:hypothetical protein [Cupriavidus pauculus]|uniref:hypothetical protein n=1 Tax=Cupriavidus pauculus TaxID=82633 RepID=UPI0038572312